MPYVCIIPLYTVYESHDFQKLFMYIDKWKCRVTHLSNYYREFYLFGSYDNTSIFKKIVIVFTLVHLLSKITKI